jgi:prevent-host-death family protein
MSAEPKISETFKVTEAKAKLSELMARAESGEEVFIARGNDPVIQLVPVHPPKKARPGRLAHWAAYDDSALFELDPEQAAIDAGDWNDSVGIWRGKPRP